jgi:hypothetical protein
VDFLDLVRVFLFRKLRTRSLPFLFASSERSVAVFWKTGEQVPGNFLIFFFIVSIRVNSRINLASVGDTDAQHGSPIFPGLRNVKETGTR